MKLKSIQIEKFRRFKSLNIENLPETARLIVLIGTNGFGKSSFFDALLAWRTAESFKRNGGWLGFNWDADYHEKVGTVFDGNWVNQINLELFGQVPDQPGKAVYVRSACPAPLNLLQFIVPNSHNWRSPIFSTTPIANLAGYAAFNTAY